MRTQPEPYWTSGLHRALQQQPDGIATIQGDRQRTFAEQADRVARLAGGLRGLGVGDGVRVGLLALNSDRTVETILAIPWADGVFNLIDTMRAPFEIAPMLAESDTEILFVDDAFAAVVPEVRRGWPRLRAVIHLGDEPTPDGMIDYEALIAGSSPAEDANRGGDALAGLVHTGGTTSAPKTVMHTHRAMLTMIMTMGLTNPDFIRPGTRQLQLTPISHVSGVGSVLMQSQFGNTLVPFPRFDPAVVLEAIEKHRITAVFIVPPMLQRVVDHPDIERSELSSVRNIMYGASPITEQLLQRASARFPQAGFAQLYGLSESLSFTMSTPEDHRRPGPQRRSGGRAMLHTELRVVDADDNDLPTGTAGEILLRGPGLMRGYWDAPDATADALRGGWMHTGDVGYLDEHGYLYIVDRLKDVVIVDGDNVHSPEVENVLASHPDVAACAVIGVPDDTTGERVHAVVVARAGSEPDTAQLHKHCGALLPDFKVPQSWELAAALPLSPTGKVLKRELRARYWTGLDRQVN
ncbi:AMP-binding protein [Microlunatus soli]|uniref:Acyl-CoA synthetase (AMP-forming)/AMP-acid ligase II n=1 Tax=Microlunatus soli TaxID=630515 RepID=A0A1H1R6C4_9ACTN|nr:AMP-binding protein [Microlunatus soli]SDS31282.1 Acyl-CoA synthetase (AMP-forming)/AMP-acid ligase II [Microlunatus soli]